MPAMERELDMYEIARGLATGQNLSSLDRLLEERRNKREEESSVEFVSDYEAVFYELLAKLRELPPTGFKRPQFQGRISFADTGLARIANIEAEVSIDCVGCTAIGSSEDYHDYYQRREPEPDDFCGIDLVAKYEGGSLSGQKYIQLVSIKRLPLDLGKRGQKGYLINTRGLAYDISQLPYCDTEIDRQTTDRPGKWLYITHRSDKTIQNDLQKLANDIKTWTPAP
jgi:hypothetical protein